jgi:hypothetical protein
MKSAAAPETVAPTVEMVPFPQIEALPPLPPAPGEQPVSPKRLRAAFIGQAIGAVGALLLLGSLFVGGWYHVSRVDVTLGDRQLDDSYIGHSLTLATNYYSLAVWAFLKRGEAIPVVIVAIMAVVASLLLVGRQRRGVVALGLLLALAAAVWIVADLRHLPATVFDLAKNSSIGFPSAVHPRGTRPGAMMFLGLGGLSLQIGGASVALFCLPRVRRVRRASRAERQPEREEQPVDQFEPRGAGEYAVQGAAPLPQQAADERWREGQGEEREQYPG